MAYENVQISNPNLCLSPRADEFGSIDHSSDVFRLKSNLGAIARTYTLNSGVDEIKALEYVGPRALALSLDQLGNELPFFTLEHVSSSGCLIKRWKLTTSGTNFNLQNTLSLTNSGTYCFDCYSMAVENYQITFGAATTTGTGFIQVSSASGIEPGDVLLLGPSGDVTNLYAFEYVTVTGVLGSNVYITSSGIIAPKYEYASGDKITYYKNIYLFSDVGQGGDTFRGSLYTINPISGTITAVADSGIYSGVRAASWSRDYGAVGFVQDNNILYLNPTSYQIQKSQVMTNVESDNVTIIPVYSVLFNGGVVYRLQLKTTLSNDSGDKTTSSWATYNYQLDSITPYTRSIDFGAHPTGVVLNDKIVTLTAVVRDQFGVVLSSRNVHFVDTPDRGIFSPLSGDVVTDSNGIASLTYETYYYNPTDPPPDSETVSITARVDGSSTTIYGSQYVWDRYDLSFYKRFRIDLNNITQMPTWSGGIPGPGSSLYCDNSLTQVSGLRTEAGLRALNKFQFPGGDWVLTNPPTSEASSIVQLLKVTSTDNLNQVSNTFSGVSPLTQVSGVSDFYQMSQLYISRHLSSGHKDTAIIDQFQFIVDAIPAFWSEKNSVDTNIWIKLRPFAFSLNQSSLVFRVREVSYAGDTGYVDVTSLCAVTTFDAGGGMLGLIINYNPASNFHHNSVVYVSIGVYDVALTPNIILTDYWFKVIADYRAPYIDNEIPSREEESVDVSTNIEFDVFDAGEGVDIGTLTMYVNNRLVTPTISGISGGYHVFYDPSADFYYGENVEIFVNIRDIGGNLLHDAWRFYCAGSTGPWIDRDSFLPKNCSKGVYRKITGIEVNVYGVDDTGVDSSSFLFTIGGKDRNITVTPIIYRID